LKVVTGSHVAGETIVYTSTVTNNGPSDAQAGTVTGGVDSHLTGAKDCLGSGCTPSSTRNGSLGLGAIAASDTGTIAISGTIGPSTPQDYSLSNTSSAASATTIDPDHTNDSSTKTVTVDTRADLSITKAGPPTAVAGDPAGFDYTITVTNNGPSDNTGGFTVT